MNKQPLFSVVQLTRVPAFIVSTYLTREGQKRYIVKSPNSPESKTHLANMLNTYDKVSRLASFSSVVNVVPVEQLAGGAVRFPYVEGTSVERKLVDTILAKKYNEATTVIDRLLGIIDKLPASTADPTKNKEYARVFGNAYSGEQKCTKVGIIDLNLDNFIQDTTGSWNLIDYEWMFNFPMPKEFLKQRFFYWFFIRRYRDMFSYHAERIEQELIAEGVAVPSFVLEKYPEVFKQEKMENVIKAESRFLQYVYGGNQQLEDIQLFSPKERTPLTKRLSLIHDYLQIPNLQGQIHTLSEQVTVLSGRLQAIERSRTYRAARKVAHLKRRVVSKIKKNG